MTERLYRVATFDRADIDTKNRTIAVSFSSEQAVDRGNYDEILDHNPENADLSFLNDSAPVLDGHDMNRQCGVVESARIEAKKGRAILRFSKGTLGTEIFNDFSDGIRKYISVGYGVTKELSREPLPDGRAAVRFAWRAMEISPVAIAADSSVGFGRSKDTAPKQMTPTQTADDARKAEIEATASVISRSFPNAKVQIEQMAAEAILRDTTEKDFKRSLLDKIDSFKTREIETVPDFNSPQAGLSDGHDIGSQFARSRTYQAIASVRGSQKREAVTEVQFSRAGSTAGRLTSGTPSTPRLPINSVRLVSTSAWSSWTWFNSWTGLSATDSKTIRRTARNMSHGSLRRTKPSPNRCLDGVFALFPLAVSRRTRHSHRNTPPAYRHASQDAL